MKQIVEESGRGWLSDFWGRLLGRRDAASGAGSAHFADLLYARPDESMNIADIPVTLRRRLQDEAIRTAFYRLEMPLRFLIHATTAGRQPESVEECHEILNLWRQGLEQEIRLTPDAYSGAVRTYEPTMERDYTIHGQCRPGDPLRIVVPCWRLQGEVVVRGEAEPLQPEALSACAAAPRWWGADAEDLQPVAP